MVKMTLTRGRMTRNSIDSDAPFPLGAELVGHHTQPDGQDRLDRLSKALAPRRCDAALEQDDDRMTRRYLTLLTLLVLNSPFGCGQDLSTSDEGDLGADQFDADLSAEVTETDLAEEADLATPVITVSSDFESGSIGIVENVSATELRLALRDDNENRSLPDNWRSWWYVRLDGVPTDQPITVTIANLGWPFLILPVYSHDQETWHRMSESEVSRTSDTTSRFTKQFSESTVWIAAFYPYTTGDLERYLNSITDNDDVSLETIGDTAQGRPIEMITITDSATPNTDKDRIWIHARTHPAETGSSFLIEGLIDFLLSGERDAQTALANFVFNIVPMHNLDGVVAGNYRTTTSSENLEPMWFTDPNEPWQLLARSPQEVFVLRDTIADFFDDEDPLPVTVALNLHSSNSEPDTAAFFFPHFGPESRGYSAEEARLWNSQTAFMSAVQDYYGPGLIEPTPAEGGSSFASNNYPETWWWKNFGADVMAITLETVYGRAGFAPDWVTDEDMRDLGEAVGLALLAYHDLPASKRGRHLAHPPRPPVELRYPELYPPAAEDELKE